MLLHAVRVGVNTSHIAVVQPFHRKSLFSPRAYYFGCVRCFFIMGDMNIKQILLAEISPSPNTPSHNEREVDVVDYSMQTFGVLVLQKC